MKAVFVLLMAFVLPFTAIAEEAEVKFGGKYIMDVRAIAGDYKVEFLMRSTGEITVLRADTDDSRGLSSSYAEDVEMTAAFNQPFAWDVEPTYLTIRSVAGSDEQAVTASITLIIERVDGRDLELKAIGGFAIYEDGPNEYTSTDGRVTIYKWNTATDEYEAL